MEQDFSKMHINTLKKLARELGIDDKQSKEQLIADISVYNELNIKGTADKLSSNEIKVEKYIYPKEKVKEILLKEVHSTIYKKLVIETVYAAYLKVSDSISSDAALVSWYIKKFII